MNKDKIQAAVSLKIVNLVKWIMEQENITEDVAYEKILSMDLYRMLMDEETGLYLEPIEYIYECYKVEAGQGMEGLRHYINII